MMTASLVPLCFLAAPIAVAAAIPTPTPDARPVIRLVDDRGRTTSRLVPGDTLRAMVDGLKATAPYDLVLRDDAGNQLGIARAAASAEGVLDPEVLWWTSGVTGPDPNGDGNGNDGRGFQTFDEAAQFLAAHPITIEVRESDLTNPGGGRLITSELVEIDLPSSSGPGEPGGSDGTRPRLWFSDALGNYRASFEEGVQTIHVTGTGLPAGAVVELFVVGDRSLYREGTALVDVTGYQDRPHKETVHLAPGSTSFTVPVWPSALQHPGRFDLVGRVNAADGTPAEFRECDLLCYGLETGILVQPEDGISPFGPQDIQAQIAGRRTLQTLPPEFRFQDVFVRSSLVLSALDPTDVPKGHPNVDFASIYVVPSRTGSQWTSNPTIGTDVTEVVELRSMKPGTLELSIGPLWGAANPAADQTRCDVILDFGSDGKYDKGLDIIDRLDGDGVTIVDDPADPGPYPVGRTEYDFVDVYDIPYGEFKDQNVDVRAVVAYPGQTAGVNVPVWNTDPKKKKEFPIVVILHGNHNVCLSGACTCSNNRIPNHKGYDYLLDLWASHGFIAVSVDGYDITGCPADRFIERGALILEHLRYWREWNDRNIPDTKFNGRFYSHVAMKKIGIAGHSRGGEGVAAALQINQDLALGYDIKAAILIAPTDYNWSTPPGGGPIEFLIRDTPVFNIMGSSDGDVISLDGAQLYDRASPAGRRATKSQALVYGADHNSWNTIWIDPSWNGGSDGVGGGRITAQQQQDTGRVYMTSWWMAWLQGRTEMLPFHDDSIDSVRTEDISIYWNYQPGECVDVDTFEQTPFDKNKNSLGGLNTATPAPDEWIENGLNPGNYDGSFYQDTRGAILGWSQVTEYVAEIPAANRDVSGYEFLAVRAAQIQDSSNPGGSQRFLVDVQDDDGRRAIVDIDTRGFAPIPLGYNHPFTGRKSMLSSIRIPLRAFRQNNSRVDLKRITKVIFTFEDSGLLAIDDLQFSK